MEPDFTAAITAALERLGRQTLLCSPIKGAGFCAAGPRAILRALAAEAPGVLFQESASELEAGVRRIGPARLLIVSPPG